MSMRVCLFGAGRIGRIHAANVAAEPAAELRYVVDVDRRAAEELAAATGAEVAGADAALAGVDAAIIASSTDTHLPLIEAAARAGVPVLCEKPLDLDTARAQRAVQVAHEAGIPLYLGFNRRYDPGFRRIRDEIAAGAIGRVEVVTITSRDPSPPPLDYVRRSGGLFRDMTIHDLDMARWLLGEEPVSVFASASCLVDPSIEEAGDVDTAVVVLRTASGALCQITNSRRCSYGYDQRLEVFGSLGMLRADNETVTRVEHAGAHGFSTEPALPFFLERYRDAYRLELHDFIGAVGGATPGPLATGTDGVRALMLADAAEAARRTGAAVPVE